MATILAFSSLVSCEAVGLSASRFALERLGHEVWGLPTIVLSNHPGRPHVSLMPVDPAELSASFDALERNGFVHEIDAVLSGYLPSLGHVDAVVDAVQSLKVRAPSLTYLCDPIFGDDGTGLYLDENVAGAIRDKLLPLADVITPNRFELAWLSGQSVSTEEDAAATMAQLDPTVLLTSMPSLDGCRLINQLEVDGGVVSEGVERLKHAPHGTGDFLAALYLGKVLNGSSMEDALSYAVRGVQIAIDAASGSDRLEIISTQEQWVGG